MKKRAIITLVLFLCWLNLSFAKPAPDDRRDGNWWRQQPGIVRLSYVTGFFDGLELCHRFSYWKFVGNPDKDKSAIDAHESYSEHVNKYLINVTNIQVVDGLNEFYNDFKNRKIMVYDAIWLILNAISGKPEKEMKKMIENWRKNVK
jgi:hypothetical protein